MGKAKMTKKMVSLAMAGSLSLTSLGAVHAAAETDKTAADISGHWAEQDLKEWIAKGWIGGYGDGSFKPNGSVTRAEFVALVNRAFGFTAAGTAAFKDLKTTDWSYAEIQKAVKAGYLTGLQDGTIHPKAPITRQEIALIVERLLGLTPSEKAADFFSDAAAIPAWSKGAIGAVGAGGIMKGYEDNSFKPGSNASRAEAVVILNHAITVKPVASLFDKPGTFGPATGSQTIKGDVTITSPGVTLRNIVIEGNLTLAAGIGEGDAVLDHVTVKGTTTVSGGGEHSIHFVDSVLLKIVVDKGTGTVRIVAEGSTTVANVVVQSRVTIEESQLTGEGFTDVQLSKLLPKGAVVTLLGSFDDIDVSSTSVRIDIPRGDVHIFTVNEDSKDNDINLGNDAKVVKLVLNAAVDVFGGGTVETAQMNLDARTSTTFSSQPTNKVDEHGNPINPPSSGGGLTQGQIDQRAADSVISLIAALPAALNITLANEAAVTAASSAYDALTAAQKALVTNTGKLNEAKTKIADLKAQQLADQQAANAVIALIDALPATADLTVVHDEAAVKAASDAYGALTAAQQALVTNKSKLTAAITKIADLKAAAPVITQIGALPAADALTLGDEAAVTAADNAYNALTAAQKLLVTNAVKLTGAKAKIAALKAEQQADQQAAGDVIALINAIPAAAQLTLIHDEAAVTAADNAYNALTAEQKLLVTNTGKLAEAKAMIADLKAAALVITQIGALPAVNVLTLGDEAAVTAADSAYNALTAEQKLLVTNTSKLTAAKAMIADLKSAAPVVLQISALPAVDALTLGDEAAVTAVDNAYNALTAEQKLLVTNASTLTAAKAKIADLKAAALVITQIGALPAANALTLGDEGAVIAADNAYNALTAAQKLLVTNTSTLTTAKAKIADLKAAAPVISQIGALPAVNALTLGDEAAVIAADDAYNALTAAQKLLVTNTSTLTAAKAQIADLKAAALVIAQIGALPAANALTLGDEAAVTAADNAYNALTASQQLLVTNTSTLTAAKAKIADLKAAALVISQIGALPAVIVLTLGDEAAVTAADNAYNALTAAQKLLVTNTSTLTAAKAKIADLKAAALVTSQIDALPAANVLTLGDEAAVTAADNAFNALTAAQKLLVTNTSALTAAKLKIADLKAAALVTLQIGALPAANALTLGDEAAVAAADNAYNALTAAQKLLVTNTSTLTAAKAKIVDLKAAAPVITQISALPATNALTLGDEAAVTAADDAYNVLTAAQKQLVTNAGTLTAAKTKIAALKAQLLLDQQAANTVINQINALPATNVITLADEGAVQAASQAYAALTIAQQGLVTNKTILDDAVAKIAALYQSLFITSLSVTNFDFETVYATQARGESITITDTNFGSHPIQFTISDGIVTIPVDLNWDIPLNGLTTGQAVGSAVDSFIQQYCNDHHIDLGLRTLGAVGFGNTFSIFTFATGPQAHITLDGGYAAFFTSNQFYGTNDDTSKNRSFTVGDGNHTASIVLEWAYNDMDDMVADLNWQLQAANVAAKAVKVDATHFKLTLTANVTITIGGTNKGQFFDTFQLN
ncbi:S-layer homology domain-containing protein [Paenibacillus sp. R14(2021)]|uniref:S-layer homology domain-containing protein n=1 Tax=Paenibacillus sp. R14(2021) TaxID=2859228 RepID=UPI001C612692|nr:S-layer homology domain-containing protein [Paenibacillus sp. R14(2021)]